MLFFSHVFLDEVRVMQLDERLHKTGGTRVIEVNITIFNLHCEGHPCNAPIYEKQILCI